MEATAAKKSIVIQFLLLSTVWGASFLFIKTSVGGISPAQLMSVRLLLGATFLILVMLMTKRRWPRELRTWGFFLLIGIFLCVLPFMLYAYAGKFLPSGLMSIYNASTPIAALLVSLVLLPEERLTGRKIMGLFVALFGVVVISAPWTLSFESGSDMLLAQLAPLASNTCYAIGLVLGRKVLRTGKYDATTVAASQIVSAAALGLLVAPFLGGLDPVQLTPQIVLSMLILGIFGTGLVYIWNNNVIKSWGATMASTSTYVIPIVGVILGIIVLQEVLTWNEPVGGVLVLLGILVSQGRLLSRRTPVGP